MAAKKRPAKPAPPAKTGSGKGVAWGLVVTAVIVAVVVLVAQSGDDDLNVPPPTATERADTVAILERASKAQNICYGWRLVEGYSSDAISVGSNLGDNVPVDEDPARCPRWIRVRATVTYTSESSESNDYASIWVDGSDDLSISGFPTGLQRLGLDDDVFIDDPGWATARAAVFLPLLAAEQGLAPPVPLATAAPDGTGASSAPTPLPDAGSDFLRDRWPYLLGAVAFLLVSALLVTIGLVQRSRHGNRPYVGAVGKRGTRPRTQDKRQS
ncbi:hypothetical protein GCM10027280_36150 [Micromonospora polyrhachis]|uniref:Uncharacterized protein n=1 Tax=Micromonospora polyrhachis TaxID=1282883 RepID=A0A7W7SQN1_9ACTN|nr:hypothetical protein [Micromonospora polyrhachis]MBB4958781.1 hypothetical protein [Micromonospora polyrhachis]